MAFGKGDPVVAAHDFNGYSSGDVYIRNPQIPANTPGFITSVRSSNTFAVKFEGYDYVRLAGADQIVAGDPELVAQVAAERAEREREAQVEGERVAAEEKAEKARVKALATPKEGDIMPDDPRIAWLWAKIEQDAEVMRYCDTYDQIVDRLGIPGRPRIFRTTFRFEGVDLTADIKGRSMDEVKKSVAEKFPTATKIEAHRTGRR